MIFWTGFVHSKPVRHLTDTAVSGIIDCGRQGGCELLTNDEAFLVLARGRIPCAEFSKFIPEANSEKFLTPETCDDGQLVLDDHPAVSLPLPGPDRYAL